MRLGFLPALESSHGGIHQYSLALLDAVAVTARTSGPHAESPGVVFARDPSGAVAVALTQQGWDVRALDVGPADRFKAVVIRWAPKWVVRRRLIERLSVRVRGIAADSAGVSASGSRRRPAVGAYFRRHGVDLMVYPAPDVLSFESGVPYVMAVHDLQHRLQPRFPEVTAGGEWAIREYLYRNGIENATLILADSEVGREDIVSLYGADEDNVRVLPFPPPRTQEVEEAEIARVLDRYELPAQYGFYPAQFWPHKNHELIIRAVAEARARGTEICVAFAGSDADGVRERHRAALVHLVDELDLSRQVTFLGFVPEADIAPLYAGARALVMPTFFGPTNIPVIEAWQLRCPVITSNIRGIREQVGDAGLLVDPESVEELTDALVRLWSDDLLRDELIHRGATRATAYTFDDFAERLRSILDDASARLAARPVPAVA